MIELSDEQRNAALGHACAVIAAEQGATDPGVIASSGYDLSNDKDPVAHKYRGFLAEIAIHSLLGTEPMFVVGKAGGVDGVLSNGYTWDSKCVKGAPKFLPVVPGGDHAVIYIMVKYHAAKDACEFMGWDYWLRIKTYEIGKLKAASNARPSHLVPRADLRPWSDLERMHFKGIERFQMRHDGRVYPVSINHQREAVKIEDVVYDKEQFARMRRMGPAAALKAHLVCQALDGKLLNVSASLDQFEANLEGPTS